MGKVITVNVHCVDGVTCVTDAHFFHKDFGSQLVINGLNLETGTQVHFSLTEKRGKPISMIGISENGIFSVDVPDNVLNSNSKRDDYEIYAFVYCTEENSGWTEHEIVIPVKMRPDKEFEQPTSEELTAFDKVTQYVSETAESIASDREQISKNKEDIEYLKKHGTGGGDSEDYKLPQATEENLGGVKASPKTDNDTVEARIGADGKLYVPAYPEQNEIPVDSALDKTSTNPVQNKAVAEAVEKLSNDKLNANALPDAINTALTQAKESGAFDGTNGTTPHIGANGNWFIGESDTGNPSRGEKGDTGEQGPQGIQGEKGATGADGKNGSDGQDGEDGADGITPHIGENGNWFIGDEDTGVSAEGKDGKTPQKGIDYFDGKTPEKGVDYFTEDDKNEIVEQVAESVGIPETLPNPNPLTFAGAVDAVYDGNTPVTVEIPSGEGGVNVDAELREYYTTAKSNIRAAIESKGVAVNDEDSLNDYARKIALIKTGSDLLDTNVYVADYSISEDIYMTAGVVDIWRRCLVS